MSPDEVLARFKSMVEERGILLEASKPKDILPIFRDFAGIEVICLDDSILFECGEKYGVYFFSIVRQFEIEGNAESNCLEQFHCDFRCALRKIDTKVATSFWSPDSDSLDDFFSKIDKVYSEINGGSAESWDVDVYQEKV